MNDSKIVQETDAEVDKKTNELTGDEMDQYSGGSRGTSRDRWIKRWIDAFFLDQECVARCVGR